jgi:hypothetical protein
MEGEKVTIELFHSITVPLNNCLYPEHARQINKCLDIAKELKQIFGLESP